jgi:RNA polymerase sigma factor (sigma-70 family)
VFADVKSRPAGQPAMNLFLPFPTYSSTRPENDVADDDFAHRRALEDEWIAVRCQLGERAAFDELFQRWHGPIWQYVRRLSDDDAAHDIAQDIWLRVLRGIGRLRDPAKLRAWLFGIAHRTWIDTLRRKYAVGVADIDEADRHELPDPKVADELEEELSAVEQELSRLPPIEREALTLFYLRELSLHEIAQALDIPIGTVKSRLHRARRMLRRELTGKGDDS